MAKALELQIQGTSNFTFDVEGEWFYELVPVYKDAANPPQLVELRETWTFKGCKIVSSDGTAATLWTSFQSFLARIESRTSHPTYARIVRDPSGSNATLRTLGPSTYEGFRFESVEFLTDEGARAASYQVIASANIRCSAVRRFADTNGIVGWEQTVSVSYPDGLRTVEWRTRITTAEGTSAVTKAASYAAIDITAYGTNYTYETNGPDGIDYLYTDADEENSRTPTICEAVSRIKQWGVSAGTTTGQGSPSVIQYSITTETDAETVTTTTTASARGPNALTWVNTKAPGGSITRKVIVDERAEKFASGTWVQVEGSSSGGGGPGSPGTFPTITAEISGGYPVISWEPITGGLDPMLFEGARLPFRLDLTINLTYTGADPKREDMKFPGELPSPWRLDLDASSQTDPVETERAFNPSQSKWSRSAKLTYWSATKPTSGKTFLEQLEGAGTTASYF